MATLMALNFILTSILMVTLGAIIIIIIFMGVYMQQAIDNLKAAILVLQQTITDLPAPTDNSAQVAAINDAATAISAASDALKVKFPAV